MNADLKVILSLMLAAQAVAAAAQDAASESAAVSGVIEVDVSARSDQGGVMVHLYSRPDGFPLTPGDTTLKHYARLDQHAAKVVFTNIPYGSYAIAVCHDENGNQDCDKNFLGIPKEGVGFSNNTKASVGPPSFQSAMFKLQEPSKKLSVALTY